MAKNIIPGLSFVPHDDEIDNGIELHSFSKSFRAPESHLYGTCRPRSDFVKCGLIYEGSFSEVYKCQDRRNGIIYALKKFIFTPQMMKNGVPESLLRQVNILHFVKHDNIVNSHEVIVGRKLESNLLLLDYCVTSLDQLMEKKCDAIYERDVVKHITRQLFSGISYLHESLVIHRNISCKNILFTECGTLKISGFRTVRFYAKENLSPAISELMYRAPELLFKAKSYGPPADIWAAGCVFANLLLKKPLFTGGSELAVLISIFDVLGTPSEKIWPGFDEILDKGSYDEKIISNNQPFSDLKNILAGVPDSSRQLLEELLIYCPDARWTASDVLKSSPYIINAPAECSTEKMASILEKALSVYQLLDIPMDLESQ